MDFNITKGTTSKRLPVLLQDSASGSGAGLTGLVFNTSGLACTYWREDAGNAGGVAVTLATATLGTWATGGFVEKDSTLLPGEYEFSIPDAALATGADWVIVMFTGGTIGVVPRTIVIQLT
jgi:hypothetical protein